MKVMYVDFPKSCLIIYNRKKYNTLFLEKMQKKNVFFLSNRKLFVLLNVYKSNLADVEYGLPQDSILRPLLFLIYINDLHLAMKFSERQPFTYDNDLLKFCSCVKSIKKQVNITY